MYNLKEDEDIVHFIVWCPALGKMCRSKFGAAHLIKQIVIEALNGPNWKFLIVMIVLLGRIGKH